MTYFHYYASTIRNLGDVGKYLVYPIAYVAGLGVAAKRPGLSVDQQKNLAANIARVTTAITYMGMSGTFFGLESEMIDANSRQALSAEMGVEPDKVQFSDYKNSNNSIVNRAYDDIVSLQKYRFGTDALFFVPWAFSKLPTRDGKSGTNEWDMLPFAGKAAYWAWETFGLKKTGHYEVVKLRENLESTMKDVSANDLLAVYQRTRTDQNLPMLDSKEDLQAIRPLLQRMADEYNKREGFGVAEIVYLVGLNKIHIHGADGKTVSQEAIEQSCKEIERVATLGLEGIREENKAKRQAAGQQAEVVRPRNFADRVVDKAFDASQNVLLLASDRKRGWRPEEYISIRDPANIVSVDLSNAAR